jgi:ribonuclease HII
MIRPLARESGLAAVRETRSDYIIGIDEVGYGACAGPLVVGAVVVAAPWAHERVKDSKAYSDSKAKTAHQKRREVLEECIRPAAVIMQDFWATPEEVDANGVDLAVQKLTFYAYEHCRRYYPDALAVLDGNAGHYFRAFDYTNAVSFPDADKVVPAVSAASVVAKANRDKYMLLLEHVYPGYAFGKHKGYATPDHLSAIGRLGICPEHRMSYKNIERMRSA